MGGVKISDTILRDAHQSFVPIKEYIKQDDDVLSYVLFPQVAVDFFKYRQAEKYKIDTDLLNEEFKIYPI